MIDEDGTRENDRFGKKKKKTGRNLDEEKHVRTLTRLLLMEPLPTAPTSPGGDFTAVRPAVDAENGL